MGDITPDMIARLAALNDPTNSNSGGNTAGSRITDLISAMMQQDQTNIPTGPAAPISNTQPPARPSNVQVGGTNNVTANNKNFRSDASTDPTRQPGRTNPSSPNPSAVAENSVDPSIASIIMSVLGGAGAAGAGYMMGRPKMMPPEVAGPEIVPNNMQPKLMPPEAGGAVVPSQDRFAMAFGDDIPDAEYREVPTKQVAETKKLPAPEKEDTSDKRPKASEDEVIEAKDESGTTKAQKKKATTAKEKLKPKVRVK